MRQSYRSNENLQLVIPPGVYDCDQSIVNTSFSANTQSGNAFDTIFQRSDCYIPVAGPCQVQLDGETIAQYQNLCLAQLEYRQKYFNDDDLISDCCVDGLMQTADAPCLTKKRWKQLGIQKVANTAQTFNNGFRLKHFLPFIFGEDQHHLIVKKQMNINIQLNPQFDDFTIASFQAYGNKILINAENTETVNQGVGQNNVIAIGEQYIGPGVFPSLPYIGGAIGMNLQPLPFGSLNQDPISIQLNMKRLIQNQYSQIEQYPYQNYFMQNVIPNDGGGQFNQTISQNQISPYQSISIIPEKTNGINITQYNFEDISGNSNDSLIQIQRQGQNILRALSLSDAKSQALMWKDKNKFSNNNLILQFDEVLTNIDLQTNVQTTLQNVQYIAGLQFIQQK